KNSPGIWTWAATGHVDEGETYDSAANRELFEEIGVKAELSLVGKMRSTHPNEFGVLDCFICVYTATIDRDTNIVVDPEEVETTRWFSPAELAEQITKEPDSFTRNMRKTYAEFFDR